MMRPWITSSQIDVLTRMVAGFHLEPGCTVAGFDVGLCLLHAVYDKTSLASRAGHRSSPARRRAAGGICTHDNGPDFRSRALCARAVTMASRSSGASCPDSPIFGGHIERLIGTQMGAVHLLPGTTFQQSGRTGRIPILTCSQDDAARTRSAGSGWEVAGHYHQRVHAGLHRPPIAVWREHEDRRNFRLPVDRLQFWVSFLPEDERSLRRDGIHFCNISYWSGCPRGGCRPIEGEAAHQI